MSRYGVDKVLWEHIRSEPEERRRYLDDPHSTLAGRELTEEESAALTSLDVSTLYRLGAHPFLLWGWWWRMNEGADRSLRARYLELIAPWGSPDFTT